MSAVGFEVSLVLGIRRYSTGAPDPRGNASTTYAAASDWPVFSVMPGVPNSPGANDEPDQPNRDLSLIAWTVYAPIDDNLPGEHDRVVYRGDEYEIDGRPDDWSQGAPWGSSLAVAVIELKRAEG